MIAGRKVPLRVSGGVALVSAIMVCVASAVDAFESSGKLEIHYINVGQGGSTLIIGPDGTRILYDFGDAGMHHRIVKYLRETVRLEPESGLHYSIISHRDKDHYFGYRGVIDAGYDFLVANFGNGSPKKTSVTMAREWLGPARESSSAGEVVQLPVGLKIALGDGAVLTVVAANGKVLGDVKDTVVEKEHRPKDENDRSVALLITYGKFHYVLDGDMGAGSEECTGRQTTQRNIQERVARALLQHKLITPQHGVDVMHVAHHGSESSTSAAYLNLIKPETAIVSVGISKKDFFHPRRAVIDTVLLSRDSERPECLTAPPLSPQHVFQTEDGQPDDDGRLTSFSALAIGDIKLVTDGSTNYEITGNNNVREGAEEARPEGWVLPFDEDSEDQ